MVTCDNKADAERDAERHEQRIEHPHRTRDIVLVGDITDRVRKVYARHQRNNRTDDDLVQMMADSRLVQKDGDQRDLWCFGRRGNQRYA